MIVIVQREVTIVMSEEEASHLLEITHLIGGPPNGPRGTFDRINDGLANAGVKRSHGHSSPNVSGNITISESST